MNNILEIRSDDDSCDRVNAVEDLACVFVSFAGPMTKLLDHFDPTVHMRPADRCAQNIIGGETIEPLVEQPDAELVLQSRRPAVGFGQAGKQRETGMIARFVTGPCYLLAGDRPRTPASFVPERIKAAERNEATEPVENDIVSLRTCRTTLRAGKCRKAPLAWASRPPRSVTVRP